MPEFTYRGILRSGKMIRGKIVSKNKREVVKSLKGSRIQPININVVKQNTFSFKKNKAKEERIKKTLDIVSSSARKPAQKKNFLSVLTGEFSLGINTKEILSFTNTLYILKKSKFNNVKALETIYDSVENKKLKGIIDNIIVGVESGQKIYQIMELYPKVFPPLYTNFVRVGEESGSLDTALLYARDYMESSVRLKKQIKGILLPKILLFAFVFVALIIGLLLGTPLIQNVYDMFGSTKELPAITQVAVKVSEWIIKYWYIALLIIAAPIVAAIIAIQQPSGRYTWDRIKIKFPIFGRLNLNIITSKFFKAMLLNLRNGLRLQDAMDVAKTVTDNYYILSLIEMGKTNLVAGGSWLEPFENERALPQMAIEMVNVGMESDLVEMMDKVSDYLEVEIDETIKRTTKVLPEVMYVFIGILIVIFVLTILVPLMDVYMGTFLFDLI